MKHRTLLSTFSFFYSFPLIIRSYIIIFFLLLTRITLCSVNPKFQACEPKTCGGDTNHQNISFPFYIISKQNSYCGLPNFGLTCSHDGFPIVNISGALYAVQNIFYSNQSLRVSIPALSGLRTTECIAPVRNFTGRSKRFIVASKQKQVLLLYGCENMQEHSIGCSAENRTRSVVALYGDDVDNLTLARKNYRGTVSVTWVEDEKGGVEEALRRGFLLNWTAENCSECSSSGGRCGFDEEEYTFRCYCPDRIDSERCYSQPGSGWTRQKKVIIGATAAAVIAGLLSICYFIYMLPRWREKYCFSTKGNQDIETFLKNHGVLTIKRYKFSDVKKMTNSFKVKLGQGGFGVVYKGKLSDGSNVAVKMLNPSKGNGKEFINEVASISRTFHVNVVTLFGFCFEGRKKVLIYEFISNGSLDKYIYIKEGVETTTLLSWDKLYQIAKGIAKGLEYLHRGCNTQILHFDIKPHNILLDENFCPKISDFGLAKLCLGKESLISDFRVLYSYGMMLLDIVGGKKNINVEGSQTSEIYFPDWIYKKLEQRTQLGPEDGVVAIEENELVKKITIVGLWCIQTIPNDRPTMSKVVEMLEGSIDSIKMPPRPALSSPVRSISESSTLLN
ncbi:LEAF RUST 10 DISEASE-RESISTANCE LOCUS RECEPTOR-LIKE PROTEIN KINASE-like 2.5 [Arachis duranensis]|uniref:non-specific serine/threonine protein kinase n=1 Tax=Arachis duranensis TaxID=130453 RepID=A0A6P4DLV9_ARADU|nr:LEAF RUST 10 DISEASE-RESISTANCE LOCUS RECEPTOR-LIKE PROTEIN KINASE-like 2.5 [Arachis duranensis]